jgi:hypothetical protein
MTQRRSRVGPHPSTPPGTLPPGSAQDALGAKENSSWQEPTFVAFLAFDNRL